MPIVLSVDSVASRTCNLAFAGMAADGFIDVQLASRPDFKFCVAPIITPVGRVSPTTFSHLNQDATYYARARSRRASGAIEAWSNTVAFRTPLDAAPATAPGSVMIEPVLLVAPVPVLGWTADNVVAGYPASNLGVDAPIAWRSKPGAQAHAVVAEVAPEPIDTIAILQTNMPETATITIKAGNTIAAGDVTYGPYPFRASANINGRPGYHGLFRLPAPIAKRFWRIEITASVPGNMLHVEHVVLGLNRKTRNHSLDKTETPLDLGSLERSRNGNPQRVRGLRMRRVDFDISVLTEAQFETLYADLGRLVGNTDPVLVAPNSKAGAFLHDRLLYGAITGGRVVNPASPRFTRSFTIDSLI